MFDNNMCMRVIFKHVCRLIGYKYTLNEIACQSIVDMLYTANKYIFI